MKLKLIGTGFEQFSGQMGVVEFKDGLSLGDVHPKAALRVAGVVGAIWEDGTPANVSDVYLDSLSKETPVETTNEVSTEVKSEKSESAKIDPTKYTEGQLGAIADKYGIAGLREISDPLNIKSNSIGTLIAAILKAQTNPTVKA